MNPIRFFDIVFYHIALLYDRVFDYSGNCVFAGIVFTSLLQWLNILVIIKILNPNIKSNPNLVLIISIAILPLTFNIIRYKKVITYEKLLDKWEHDKGFLKYFRITISIIYVLGTIAVLDI